jgi:CTP synthase
MAVVAAARNAGLGSADTTEFNPLAADPVITTMEGQECKQNTGGTMRLGNYECRLLKDSQAATLYGETEILERHRHRYECNPIYTDRYEQWGIRAVGTNPGTGLVEVIEAPANRFFMASQYHPEFKSRPARAHPMFAGFIAACLQKEQ